MATKKPETELSKLKKKCLKKDGTPRKDATGKALARLKQLMDAEPLSKAELEDAQKREDKQLEKDKADYKARMESKRIAAATGEPEPQPDKKLDKPQPAAEHPRINKLKDALEPFTKLEVHESRPDEFILINRGVAITAGDVRTARRAMKL